MPKRVVDGDGLWRSDKLSLVEPPSRRAELANLVPLALANGVFEANPRRVWSSVYSYNRPDVSADDVGQILAEFERAKLLFRWTEPATGKVWGYWIGIDKPGRLPGKSRRGRNETVGPEPPEQELRQFMDSNGIQNLPVGKAPLPGFGSGSGSGINPLSEPKGGSDGVKAPNQTNPTNKPNNCGYSSLAKEIYAMYPRKVGKEAALKAIDRAIRKIATNGATDQHADFNGDAADAAEWLKSRVTLYRNSALGSRPDKEHVPHPSTWINEGRYEDDEQEWSHVPSFATKRNFGPPTPPKLPDSYIPASEQMRQELKARTRNEQ